MINVPEYTIMARYCQGAEVKILPITKEVFSNSTYRNLENKHRMKVGTQNDRSEVDFTPNSIYHPTLLSLYSDCWMKVVLYDPRVNCSSETIPVTLKYLDILLSPLHIYPTKSLQITLENAGRKPGEAISRNFFQGTQPPFCSKRSGSVDHVSSGK